MHVCMLILIMYLKRGFSKVSIPKLELFFCCCCFRLSKEQIFQPKCKFTSTKSKSFNLRVYFIMIYIYIYINMYMSVGNTSINICNSCIIILNICMRFFVRMCKSCCYLFVYV